MIKLIALAQADLHKELEALNRYIHEKGLGQGEIDSISSLYDEVDALKLQAGSTGSITDEPELLIAAKAVVERWDLPLWKDARHTGAFINRLRKAIEVSEC